MVTILARKTGKIALPSLAGACFVVLFTYPILQHLSGVGVVWDWAEFLQRNWVSYHTITYFHQCPFGTHGTVAVCRCWRILRPTS